MDPCKIIALSYHYIRCFVAMATAISRNSGRRLNISLSLVPIATKVRPATHICFYTCVSARFCSRTGGKKDINDYRKLFSDRLSGYKLAGCLCFRLTVWNLKDSIWFYKGKQTFLVECFGLYAGTVLLWFSSNSCPFPSLLSHQASEPPQNTSHRRLSVTPTDV